ncbi:adenosylcobinamide amidohydrolase [Paracoccus sp. (in: a-proteobacteria)]|uniref:adenosylcobinamide amidohydrolase n=1 Tax=Paracoccus sp. TaxID=267 RepID=UPI00289DD1E3|nr:adenosylcobinamide amidohydrolase [Paracoccus sp. (in: a-proteobacteria)]
MNALAPKGDLRINLKQPWLEIDLGRQRSILSHAPYRPGFVNAHKILWREVRNADLAPDFDAHLWLSDCIASRDPAAVETTVAMMTSRRISAYRSCQFGPVQAVATVGLGNAERVGHRRDHARGIAAGYGTINIAAVLDAGLSPSAMIEALTIVAQARTAAIMAAGLRLPFGLATGTGTDCIVLAADDGPTAYAGLHTALGEALGRACYQAVLQGAKDWIAEQILHPQDNQTA